MSVKLGKIPCHCVLFKKLLVLGVLTHMQGRGKALEDRPGEARSGQGVLAVVPAPDAVSRLGKARDLILGKPYTEHQTCDALSGHGLSLLLGGVPVNPMCYLLPQTAEPPISSDRCSPDKHSKGNVQECIISHNKVSGKAWSCLMCFRAIVDMRTWAIVHQSFGKVGFTVLF